MDLELLNDFSQCSVSTEIPVKADAIVCEITEEIAGCHERGDATFKCPLHWVSSVDRLFCFLKAFKVYINLSAY